MIQNPIIECLQGNIGYIHPALCPQDCEFETPENIPESPTGFYIDGFDEGAIKIVDLFNAMGCEGVDFWEQVKAMEKQAISQFLIAFGAKLNDQNSKNYTDTNLSIGDLKKISGPWIKDGQYVAAKFSPKCCVKGMMWKVNAVDLWMYNVPDGTTFTGHIYSDEDFTTPLHQIEWQMLRGKANTRVNWKLPICNSKGDTITYYIIYDSKGYDPQNSLWNCGCGTNYRKWESYFTVGTCCFDEIHDFENTACNEDYSGGLCIMGSLTCDPLAFLCNLDLTCGYGQYVMGAIQLIFRRLAGSFIGRCGPLTAQKILNLKDYAEMGGWYDAQIDHYCQYLVQEYTNEYSDCYLCTYQPDCQVVNNII